MEDETDSEELEVKAEQEFSIDCSPKSDSVNDCSAIDETKNSSLKIKSKKVEVEDEESGNEENDYPTKEVESEDEYTTEGNSKSNKYNFPNIRVNNLKPTADDLEHTNDDKENF